ncbi:M23 family metallopeptidase [Cohnella sp.]|uniref:M23 family metallopeptidase n=1 Tax=Cohnella sp. TaxID=1883426 RepID=UPI003569A90A
MTQSNRKPKWTLLLIRDAEQRVKQFRVSARTAMILPAAVAITITACFVVMELHALYRIHDLEARLENDSIQLTSTVAGKNEEIAFLKQELTVLNGQTEALKKRMDGMNELEHQLQQFIKTYGGGSSDPRSLTLSSPQGTSSTAKLAHTVTDFSELSQMLDEMAVNMEFSLRTAEQKRTEVDTFPSEWPTVSRQLTSSFGYRRDPISGKSTFHEGVDISGEVGDPIYAAGEGRVKEAEFDYTRGNYIIITHRNGLESWYLHLSKIAVKTGQLVERGASIGKLGNSGRSTGPHLHFQVVLSEKPVNPLPYLKLVKED